MSKAGRGICSVWEGHTCTIWNIYVIVQRYQHHCSPIKKGWFYAIIERTVYLKGLLDADDKNWVEPDISVICDPDKLTDRGCSGAPDFIVEVVSPGSRRMDYAHKVSLYLESGVREYWIVDPLKKCTTVYLNEQDPSEFAPIIFPFESNIKVGIYADLSINISQLL